MEEQIKVTEVKCAPKIKFYSDFFFFFLLQPCMFSPKIPYAKLYFLQSSAIKPDKTSSLGYQISTCASKVYCSGGMHFITVVSKLNRLFYQLHSENNQKYIF